MRRLMFLVTVNQMAPDGSPYEGIDAQRTLAGQARWTFDDVIVSEIEPPAGSDTVPVFMTRAKWSRLAAVIDAVDDPQPSVRTLRESIKRDIGRIS
jgi:hypothetical protein